MQHVYSGSCALMLGLLNISVKIELCFLVFSDS